MIFDFALDSLEKVHPWGTTLHWFALTQGSYRLKVGDEYLLNYTDEFIKYLSEKYPEYIHSQTTFVDYYVVRLWEDILELFPAILEPVPQQFQHFLNSGYENYQSLNERALDWQEFAIENGANKDETWEVVNLATDWINSCWLDSGYLSPSARIWIWSDESDVIVSWDNSEIEIEEIPVWTAIWGNYRMSKDLFVKEVCEFDKHLFEQMDQRVEDICKNWKNEEIKIDFEELKSEQSNRATWFNLALKRIRQTDWNRVVSDINQISE